MRRFARVVLQTDYTRGMADDARSSIAPGSNGSERRRASHMGRVTSRDDHLRVDTAPAQSSGLANAEARVEAQSASLKKELGVRDLALTQILFIVGLTWIG